MKRLFWVGGVLARLRSFPEDARREAGHQLYQVQLGLKPGDWKPMSAVGPGVVETQQTQKPDIELARRRLGEVVIHRGR